MDFITIGTHVIPVEPKREQRRRQSEANKPDPWTLRSKRSARISLQRKREAMWLSEAGK